MISRMIPCCVLPCFFSFFLFFFFFFPLSKRTLHGAKRSESGVLGRSDDRRADHVNDVRRLIRNGKSSESNRNYFANVSPAIMDSLFTISAQCMKLLPLWSEGYTNVSDIHLAVRSYWIVRRMVLELCNRLSGFSWIETRRQISQIQNTRAINMTNK